MQFFFIVFNVFDFALQTIQLYYIIIGVDGVALVKAADKNYSDEY